MASEYLCPICKECMEAFGMTTSDMGDNVEVQRCRRCGMAGLDWSTSSVEREGFFSSYSYEKEEAWRLSRASEQSLRRWVQMLAPYEASKQWLDVGCGAGGLLRIASELGWKVEGTELSKLAIERLGRQGYKVHFGGLSELRLPRQRYDVVSMVELLEHLIDPVEYVGEGYEILRPGGALFLTTPNFDGLFRRLFGPRETLTPPDHLWGFTVPAVRTMLHRAGFEETRVWTDGLNPWRLLELLNTGQTTNGETLTRRTETLREASHDRIVWRSTKSLVDLVARVTRLGSTLKAIGVKPLGVAGM